MRQAAVLLVAGSRGGGSGRWRNSQDDGGKIGDAGRPVEQIALRQIAAEVTQAW